MSRHRCRNTGKVIILNRAEAEEAADRIALKRWNTGENAWMNAYKCKGCKQWHVGTVMATERRPREKHIHRWYHGSANRYLTRRRIRAGNFA